MIQSKVDKFKLSINICITLIFQLNTIYFNVEITFSIIIVVIMINFYVIKNLFEK